jgi:hypothetical protein
MFDLIPPDMTFKIRVCARNGPIHGDMYSGVVGRTVQRQRFLYQRGLHNIVLSGSTYHKRGFVCGTFPL